MTNAMVANRPLAEVPSTKSATHARSIDWRKIYDEVAEMEFELSLGYWSECHISPAWAHDDEDIPTDAARLSEHKDAYRKRFTRLRNKRFLPLRRYGASYDRHELVYDEAGRQCELEENARHNRKLDAMRALDLEEQEQDTLREYRNYRESINESIEKNKRSTHSLESGSHSTTSRLILSYCATANARALPKSGLYDSRTGCYYSPTPTKPTAKSTRVLLEVAGSYDSRIQVWQSQTRTHKRTK